MQTTTFRVKGKSTAESNWRSLPTVGVTAACSSVPDPKEMLHGVAAVVVVTPAGRYSASAVLHNVFHVDGRGCA